MRLICNILTRWEIRIICRNYSTDTEKLPLRTLKRKTELIKVKPVIDVKTIRAIGGKGGDGCISFLRLWKNDRAGPDGGDGGNGGHILIEASTSINSLNHLNSIMKGENGEKGSNKDCNGKNAQHTIVKVPIGTVVKYDSTVVGDLSEEGSLFILARGGAGGRGNKFFASDLKQTPVVAEYGANGEDRRYTLELKSVANFGLVGLPNAGKSTLLQAISRAKPKVASYPFTTLKPHIGMVQYRDYEQISVADLPGLIEGSHLGKGLGIQFLRHTERCSCLIIVLDVTKNPYETFLILKKELSAFYNDLTKKKQLIVLNKIDLPYSEESIENLINEVGADNLIKLSAKYGLNLSEFLNKLRTNYEENFTND
ncbi:GTPase Obg isoform X3 [Halyomorpha halys]|uniref:GTPase Obg isoform X3 n=1 Tax=Halyomorpha halys TaxID=286706 RepID=UPI0006D4CFC8|nr:uncharacterized protein LOC106680244 isoform X3 [Halyomorpha halys]